MNSQFLIFSFEYLDWQGKAKKDKKPKKTLSIRAVDNIKPKKITSTIGGGGRTHRFSLIIPVIK